MKERPILFSAAMVKALLSGNKTQTRRVCKPMQQWVNQECREVRMHEGVPHHFLRGAEMPIGRLRCPYGQPGDRLWVRETWTEDPEDDGTWAYTQYMGCKGSPLSDIPRKFQKPEHCIYREGWDGSPLVWRPSIHMPRWASRILLEIVSVRVERLQAISTEGVIAEGINTNLREHDAECDLHDQWRALWESIYGAGNWATNPWVWAVEFKRVPA